METRTTTEFRQKRSFLEEVKANPAVHPLRVALVALVPTPSHQTSLVVFVAVSGIPDIYDFLSAKYPQRVDKVCLQQRANGGLTAY